MGGTRIGIANIVIHVGDMERALRFYQDGLGLTVRFDTGARADPAMLALSGSDPAIAMRLVVLDIGGTAGLALSSFDAPAEGAVPFERGGQAHVGLIVEDALATRARTIAAGGTPFGEPGIVGPPDRRSRLAFVRDPDGTVIELVEHVSTQEGYA